MTYIGLYRCFRVDALTVEEWKNLSSGFRKGYSEITLSKTRSDLKGIYQDERQRADYENGFIRVPCVRLIASYPYGASLKFSSAFCALRFRYRKSPDARLTRIC
ncbi:hypothetical protein MPER_08991 [Moniliophthora perniciosa FA553]|nr:hypothetical protein MPER_08991 [Moniliophthora perniciosa FA553]